MMRQPVSVGPATWARRPGGRSGPRWRSTSPYSSALTPGISCSTPNGMTVSLSDRARLYLIEHYSTEVAVKRRYESTRRQEQARQTRRAILAAATRLFVDP